MKQLDWWSQVYQLLDTSDIQIFLSFEVFAVVLNAVCAGFVWRKSRVGITIKYFLSVLTTANIVTNVLNIIYDVNLILSIPQTTEMCLAQFILYPVTFLITMAIVMAMGIERLVALRRPFKYKDIFTRKNTLFMITGIVLCSCSVSLITIPDFLENQSGMCLPLDIYPKGYATVFIGSCICISFVLVNIILVCVIYSFRVFAQRPLRSLESAQKALVASRIALGSAFFYSVCCGIFFIHMFWLQFSDCDNNCLATNYLTYIVDIFMIIFTLVDPLIYFLSLVKCKGSKRQSRIHPIRAPEGRGSSSPRVSGSPGLQITRTDQLQGSSSANTDHAESENGEPTNKPTPECKTRVVLHPRPPCNMDLFIVSQ